MWVRGLKPEPPRRLYKTNTVAPYVGAWIETSMPYLVPSLQMVAPYVGAWIETVEFYEQKSP